MISELVLSTLAFNLATAPSAADLSLYQQLNQADRARVEELVHRQDQLPDEITTLLRNSNVNKIEAMQPTRETESQ